MNQIVRSPGLFQKTVKKNCMFYSADFGPQLILTNEVKLGTT
jgi:hypothetical protein